MIQEHFIASPAGRVHVWERPGSSENTLVFLHGNSSSSDAFRHLDRCLDPKYRLLGIDWPGHGASDKAVHPESTYSFQGYARLLRELLSCLAPGPCIIVGHSLGGHVALEAELPANVRGLALIAAPPLSGNSSLGQAFHDDPTHGLLFRSDLAPDELQALGQAFLTPMAPSTLQKRLAYDIQRTDGAMRAALGQNLAAQGVGNEVAEARKSGIPVLLIQGGCDAFIRLSYFAELDKSLLWRQQPFIFMNCGHYPHLEEESLFANFLAEYCREIFS
jgi:pimeloyl-ACP methyl ester carboxylesterase